MKDIFSFVLSSLACYIPLGVTGSRVGYRFTFQELIQFQFSRFRIDYHESTQSRPISIVLVLVRECAELAGICRVCLGFICCGPMDSLDMGQLGHETLSKPWSLFCAPNHVCMHEFNDTIGGVRVYWGKMY